MRKLVIMALKEARLAFRDVGAIIWMIGTPLVLTLAVAAAFGRGENPLPETPALLLNQDAGPLGQAIEQTLNADQFKGLVAVQRVNDADAARAQVEADQAAVLVIVPPDLSARLTRAEPAVVELYASPARPIGASIVHSILSQILSEADIQAQGTSLLMRELAERGVAPDQWAAARVSFHERLARAEAQGHIQLAVISTGGRAFNWLNYFAPSMAILFLMFNALGAGRTLLDEKQIGTLARLLVTPTRSLIILLGKMSGVALTGLLQMLALFGATSLVGADWGDWRLALAGIVVLVVCVTGLGAMIAAWSKTPLQANLIGLAFLLTASALAGNFVPRMNLPTWVQSLSLITPNAWGLEIFIHLQAGAGPEVLPLLGGTLGLSALYYLLAAVGFRRQFA